MSKFGRPRATNARRLLVISFAVISLGLLAATGPASAQQNNDHIWNNSLSTTLCHGCYSTLYVNAWSTVYPAPNTLSVTPLDMNPYTGGSPTRLNFGWATGSSASYLGYWFAGANVNCYLSTTCYPDLMLTFANGT
jgi:hypothetical protein